jgi:hypothetical protein
MFVRGAAVFDINSFGSDFSDVKTKRIELKKHATRKRGNIAVVPKQV